MLSFRGSITEDSYKTLLKNCITRGHESVLEHEKITIRMTCDIGVYKDLTRHRIASFSVESTRYCNYGKDKFDNELKVMRPCNIEEGSTLYTLWENTMKEVEKIIWQCLMKVQKLTNLECYFLIVQPQKLQ